MLEKCLNNDETFFNYFRVTPKQYENILSLIDKKIKDSNFKKGISTKDRLAATLRYLASGDITRKTLASFQIAKSSVSGIIAETCEAITDALQPLVMSKPTREKWLEISRDFYNLWQIPHCLGAIDIKHIEMQAASGMGWTNYNRKGACTLALLAVVDSHCYFVLADVGAPGHLYDKVILENSNIGHQLQNGLLSLPPPEIIPETNMTMPYSFIGDKGFPLQENLMRPYPGTNLSKGQEIFNCNISQARQCIENAFGLMSAHFRILQSPISASVEEAVAIVEATTCLHNYIMLSENSVPADNRHYCKSKLLYTQKLLKEEDPGRACDGNSSIKELS